MASQNGYPEIASILLQNGADPLATTKSGKTALSAAVSSGHVKVAEILLRTEPILINTIDMGGSTCLMRASENASANKNGPTMVELLIRSGVSIHAIDTNGQTALDRLCATSGNVRAAQVLIKAGAEIRMEPTRKRPMTHLMVSAMNGHKELCRELMEKHGMDPRIKNDRGWDALKYAECSGHVGAAKIIEERIDTLIAIK